jgi:glycogen operon protein
MLNAYWEPLRFQLPTTSQGAGASWRRWIDTALPTPEDIAPWETAQTVLDFSYLVQPRSVACLVTPGDGTRLQW